VSYGNYECSGVSFFERVDAYLGWIEDHRDL